MAGTLTQTYFVDEVSAKPGTVGPGTFIVDETGEYGWALRPKDYDRELLVTVDSQAQHETAARRFGRLIGHGWTFVYNFSSRD